MERGNQRFHCKENQTGTINRRIRIMYNQALGVLLRACVVFDGVVVERLLYNYVDLGLLKIKNIDLPEKLKRSEKSKKTRENSVPMMLTLVKSSVTGK